MQQFLGVSASPCMAAIAAACSFLCSPSCSAHQPFAPHLHARRSSALRAARLLTLRWPFALLSLAHRVPPLLSPPRGSPTHPVTPHWPSSPLWFARRAVSACLRAHLTMARRHRALHNQPLPICCFRALCRSPQSSHVGHWDPPPTMVKGVARGIAGLGYDCGCAGG